MDTIFQEFGDAHTSQDGYQLSRTISPALSIDMLRVIWRSFNSETGKGILEKGLTKASRKGLHGYSCSKQEIEGWVEVYRAYWTAIGELLAIYEPLSVNGRVSTPSFLILSFFLRFF
jgi:hypothetical protein